MSHESQHADTLNALHEMQSSVAYAARRQVLADAERLIVKQARVNAKLLEACKEMLDAFESPYPPYKSGSAAQHAWADRKYLARTAACEAIALAIGDPDE